MKYFTRSLFFAVILNIVSLNVIAEHENLKLTEQQFHWQTGSSNSQKANGETGRDIEIGSDRWFQEYILGIGEYLTTPDLPPGFKGDIYARSLQELKADLNLTDKEISLIREIAELETEREQLGKELWYMETLPGRMPEEIRAKRTEEDEQQRLERIRRRKKVLKDIEVRIVKKVERLRKLLGEREKNFEKWIIDKKIKSLDKFKVANKSMIKNNSEKLTLTIGKQNSIVSTKGNVRPNEKSAKDEFKEEMSRFWLSVPYTEKEGKSIFFDELKIELNLSSEDIERLIKVKKLQEDIMKAEKSLWYIETLPGRMYDSIGKYLSSEEMERREQGIEKYQREIERDKKEYGKIVLEIIDSFDRGKLLNLYKWNKEQLEVMGISRKLKTEENTNFENNLKEEKINELLEKFGRGEKPFKRKLLEKRLELFLLIDSVEKNKNRIERIINEIKDIEK